jgi:hypothetical protein
MSKGPIEKFAHEMGCLVIALIFLALPVVIIAVHA